MIQSAAGAVVDFFIIMLGLGALTMLRSHLQSICWSTGFDSLVLRAPGALFIGESTPDSRIHLFTLLQTSLQTSLLRCEQDRIPKSSGHEPSVD